MHIRRGPLTPVVLALDCDGTLQRGHGPITDQRLEKLKQLGVEVVLVSPSPSCAALGPPTVNRMVSLDRKAALQELARQHPNALLVYSGDTEGDRKLAEDAGWIYAKPDQVARGELPK